VKALVIEFNGREIERFVLDRPTVFIGRSPSCDVVLRLKGIKPLHYLIEWVGEGQFSTEKGFWTLLDLSTQKKDQARGEGIILSAAKTKVGKFSFGFTEDDWIEKEIAKGKLKRQVQLAAEAGAPSSLGMSEYCLETVSVRNDSDRVDDVTHTNFFSPRTSRWLIRSKSQIKLQWQDPTIAFLEFLPTQEKWDIKNRDEIVHDGVVKQAQKYEITPRDVMIASGDDRQYYIRLVPRIKIQAQWKRDFFDPLILGFLSIIFITFSVSQYLQKNVKIEVPLQEPPRIVRVDLPAIPKPEVLEQEAQAAEPEAVEVVEPAPEPEQAQAKESTKPVTSARENKKQIQKSKVKTKPAQTPEPAPTVVTKTKTSTKKAATTNKTTSKPGLPGVLGVLKRGSGGAKPLKADVLIANRAASEMDSQPSPSTVAVSRSSPGALAGAKNTGSSKGADLNTAGTSVKGAFISTPGESGISGKDTGTLGSGALSGAKSSGGKKGITDRGSFAAQTEIEGGLDADAVKKTIREYSQQFRSCYENYLTSSKQKDESGRVSLLWIIKADGKVTNNAVVSSTFASRELGQCIKGVVDKILFPNAPNGMPTRVRFPFVFQGKK
jgi:outer membrane biosynthesis protein TonB